MQRSRTQRTISRSVLAALCLWLLGAAVTCDRRDWSSFMGDEATYLMQAESLAWDLDLIYQADDYHRLITGWQLPPQGLILQSGDGGATITYGKPFFYAAYLAPFLRAFDHRGLFIANALLLILAAALASSVLERRLGHWGSLWTASLVFATVTFASTFWIHADLFLMCLTAMAFSLVFDLRRRASADLPIPPWRFAVIGGLLAIVVFSRPPYLPLLLVALWLLPEVRRRGTFRRDSRWRGALLTLASAALLVAGSSAVHHQLTGSWTPYGALRSGFYAHTGYPGIDFPVEEWTENVHGLGNAAARSALQTLRERKLPMTLLGWNSFYFFFGRHVGILIYFLPLLLLLRPATREDRYDGDTASPSWLLLGAVLLSVAFFLWTRPFNFYGGGGSLANRYFLPLFPALWFVPRRRMRVSEILLVVSLSAVFLLPLWRAPRQFPITQEGTYRYASSWAQQFLPFETTQSHLRLAGREDLYEGFYLRLTSPLVKRGKDGYFRLEAGGQGEMVLGSSLPLGEILLETKSAPMTKLEIKGAQWQPPEVTPEGTWIYRLTLDPPLARHPMWWTWQQAHLYRLRLRFGTSGESLAVFRLKLPIAQPTE